MSDKIERAYSWDDEVEIVENEYTYNLMPTGTVVDFEVVEINKKHNKKWNCPMMEAKLKCTNPDCGTTTVYETISLHSKAQFFINRFFAAINLVGEGKNFGRLVEEAIGRRGKAKLKVDSWESNKTDADGKPIVYQNNKIDQFLKAEGGNVPAAAVEDEDIF